MKRKILVDVTKDSLVLTVDPPFETMLGPFDDDDRAAFRVIDRIRDNSDFEVSMKWLARHDPSA